MTVKEEINLFINMLNVAQRKMKSEKITHCTGLLIVRDLIIKFCQK